MSRLTYLLAVAGVLSLVPPLAAQSPGAPGGAADRGRAGPPPARRPMPGPAFGGGVRPGRDLAEELLSHTGDLKLSDPQVTRLAAIARRSADRRQTMRRSMDSLMASRGTGRADSVRGRMGPPAELRATAERMRDQMHGDLRDALAVLSPDQLATAWEIGASRGPANGPGFRARPMGGLMGGAPGYRGRSGFGRGGPSVPPPSPAR